MESQDLAFSQADIIALNITIAAMMFGVSLQLRLADFHRLLRMPVAPVLGLLAQFVLLPALTCLLTWVLAVPAELALGMMLVAACPGGSFSNLMTWIARGSLPVSVTMTAFSSLAAVVLTPLNFQFYAGLNPNTAALMREIAVPQGQMLLAVLLILGLPIALGMAVGARWPRLAAASDRPMRVLSLLVFLGFVALAVHKNLNLLLQSVGVIVPLVIAHNLLALGTGATAAALAGLPADQRRAVTLEVGIQNSGLGLTLLFTFFPQAGGMILIAACWGVWHLISGLSLSVYWSRKSP